MTKYTLAKSLLSPDGRAKLFAEFLTVRAADYKLRFGVTLNRMQQLFGGRGQYSDQFVAEYLVGNIPFDAVLPRPVNSVWHTWESAAIAIGGTAMVRQCGETELEEDDEPVTSRYVPSKPKRSIPEPKDVRRKHGLSKTALKALNQNYTLSEIDAGHWERGVFKPAELFANAKYVSN